MSPSWHDANQRRTHLCRHLSPTAFAVTLLILDLLSTSTFLILPSVDNLVSTNHTDIFYYLL